MTLADLKPDLQSDPDVDRLLAERRKHWTVDEFHRLADQSYFADKRVELIDGEIVHTPPMNEPHGLSILRTQRALLRAFGETATVRVQLSFRVSEDTELLPDIALVAGNQLDLPPAATPPSTALLIIEISDSTYLFDRFKKSALYAQANIPDYWIVNLPAQTLEVLRLPRKGQYTSHTTLHRGDHIQPLANPQQSLAVNDLLPVQSDPTPNPTPNPTPVSP